MYLSSPIDKNGIFEETLRICNCTNAVYSIYAMVARVNDALDRYWFLAVSSACKGSFDDKGYSTLPVETQSIVSGINAYKMTSFTNEVLQILKVSVLDSDGVESDLDREDFDDIEDFAKTYSSDTTGVPTRWTKKGDYIYIYPMPDYSETNGLRVYVNREMSKYSWVSVVGNTDDTLTTTSAHGLVALDGVIFETDGTIITPITADTVVYYVITDGLTTTKFKVSTAYSATGTAVNISDAQTGSNHKYLQVNKEPGIPVIHHLYLAKYAALAFMNPKHPNFSKTAAEVQMFEQDIMDYWRTMESENNAMIESSERCFK